MKKNYLAPELELISLKLNDVILTSTESGVPGYSEINPGDDVAPTEFADDL